MNETLSYLEPNGRPLQRFYQNEEDQEEMPLYQKAGLAAVAGAIALGVGHRTGAIRKIARILDTEVKGTFQAAREIMEERKLTSNLSVGQATDDFKRFLDRRKSVVQERKIKEDRLHEKREYDMQRYLRQRERMIEDQVPYHIEESMRYRDVVNRVRTHFQGTQSPEDAEATTRRVALALEKGSIGVFKYGHDRDIKFLLENGDVEEMYHDAVLDAVNHYRNENYHLDEETQRWVKGMQEKLRETSAQQIQNTTQKQGKFSDLVIGHRQATIEDILQLHDQGKFQLDDYTRTQIQDVLKYNSEYAKAVFDENLFLIEKNGKVDSLMDYKVFDEMKQQQMEWWAPTIPGGLLHMRDILNIRHARDFASFRIMDRKVVQPMLNAQRNIDNKESLHEPVVFMSGKFYRLMDAEAINSGNPLEALNQKRDMYLTSAKFGTIPKVSRQVSDLMTGEKDRNFLFRTLDIGNQDKRTGLGDTLSIATKFGNPMWERNLINRALENGVEYDDFFQIRKYFEKYTEGLHPRILNHLYDQLPGHIQQEFSNAAGERALNFSRDDDMMKLFDYLGKSDVSSEAMKRYYKEYQRDPYAILGKKQPIGEGNPIIGTYASVRTGMDDIRQQISMELMRQMETTTLRGQRNMRDVFDELFQNGQIYEKDYQEANFLYNHYLFSGRGSNIFNDASTSLGEVSQLFMGTTTEARTFQQSMRKMTSDTNPWWQKFHDEYPHNQIEEDYLAVNKANFNSLTDIFRQMGLTTGRRNMEDFTTLSIFGSNYPIYRLQDALGDLGLGFSDDSMGSPLQIAASLALKRFLPMWAGYEYGQYLDYQTDEWTGSSLSDRWENYKAKANIEDARMRDALGINEEIQRRRMLYPGLEHFAAMPSLYLPGIGEVGAGNVAAAALLVDAPIDEKDAMTEEEILDYYANGEEEIRKGRWWLWGSKTAYRGDRIQEFAPNAYRMAMSDWEYTNVTATGEERWSHSLLPTMENPLGFLGWDDPYWYEKKHYYDRPYLLTGSMFNPNTLGFGDIGNATIGQLIKPVRQMHPEYWGDPVLIQQEIADDVQRPISPIVTTISPGARMEHEVMATPTDYGVQRPTHRVNVNALHNIEEDRRTHEQAGEPLPSRYFSSPELDEQGNRTGAYVVQDMTTGEAIFVPAQVAKEGYQVPHLFEMAQTEEQSIATAPRAMFDEDFAYRNELANQKLRNMQDPRSLEWLGQEFTENLTEPLGAYKWIMQDELLGYNPYKNQTVIEKADQAYNASNRFWESELGSLGGQLSEIGRRFIRRNDGELDFYNPIRNTMPEWMPGPNYFIDFLHGDPYCVSPDTLVEINGGILVCADEVNKGDIIKTHKGVLRHVEAVKRRDIKTNEKVYRFTVATLPAFPFTVSEEHPILTVKDSAQRKNYGQLKYIQLYEQANQIINLLRNGPMKKKEIHEVTGIHYSRITLVCKKLVEDGLIFDKGRRGNVYLIKDKLYDIELYKRGIEWVQAKDVEVGHYVAYPLPKQTEQEIVLDMLDYLDGDKFTFFEDEVRFGFGTKQFHEIYVYLKENGIQSFGWGKRKEFLLSKGWSESIYDHAVDSIKKGWSGRSFPRHLPIDKDLARLMGYWVAEGWADQNAIGWAFHQKEEEYRKDIDQTLNRIIEREAFTRTVEGHGVQHTIGCQPLAILLSSLFGNGARNKRLPEWWINLPNATLIEFLKALFNGDGSSFNHNGRNRISLHTASKQLAYQVRLILLKLGIVASISEGSPSETVGPRGKVIYSGISYHVNINGPGAVILSDMFGYDLVSDQESNIDYKATWYIDDMYLYLRVNKKEAFTFNDVPEVIGFEVGVDDSFCVAGVATHNTKVPRGEYRLPGEAYERINALHSDETGYYGAFDKFKILADVAPWSDEYKFWRDYVIENTEDKELRKQAAEIKRQVAQRKQKYEFTDYRFEDAKLDYQNVTVTKFLDDYTFLTKEFGDTPIRMAGMEYRKKAEGVLQQYFKVGDQVTVGIDADPVKRKSEDTYGTMRAVVYKDIQNVNQDIIQRGMMKENKKDFSSPAVHARFTKEEIAEGARWERIAHAESPLNTKFLQVRTAVEEYERDQVYGKDWATWENFLISDYLIPGTQADMRHGFFESAFRGGVTGAVLGYFVLGGGRRTVGGAIIGALTTGSLSLYRQFDEWRTGEVWIPERRKKEMEINEFFDVLKYMKYSGLYEQAKAEAADIGYDVDEIVSYIEGKKEDNRSLKRALENEKKQLYLEQPKGWEDRRKQINQDLEALKDNTDRLILPQPVLQALQYKEERDTTLYAIDPHGDRMQLMKAFPYKDKWFVEEFINAGTEDRKRILELVPENQRRIYRAIWGMGEEEAPHLEEVFSKYYLPDETWEGWLPEYNLEDFKVKVVQQQGLDLSDFNFWTEDVMAANTLPNLQGSKNDIYQSSFLGYREMQERIRAILEGQGIRDVQVQVSPSEYSNVQVQYEEDRSGEVSDGIRQYMDSM